jgi:hypothetical protein
MKLFIYAIMVASMALSTAVQAHGTADVEHKLCEFAPENDLRIPEGLERFGGITEAEFNLAIDRVEKIYKPIVKKLGGELEINRLWSNSQVNANATRKGNKWVVNAFGGLARYEHNTFDGEMMVLCHEIGHHMGGFPKYPGIFGGSWASNEGQSDYFATMKCFRRVIENDDNASIVSKMNVPVEVARGCQLGFTSAKDIAICKRSAMTGKTLAVLLYHLGRGTGNSSPVVTPDFDTPVTTQVSSTNDKHPQAQCRLDTYFAGAICGVSKDIAFSDREEVTGACSQARRDAFGFRPRCWFKPAGVR